LRKESEQPGVAGHFLGQACIEPEVSMRKRTLGGPPGREKNFSSLPLVGFISASRRDVVGRQQAA